MNCAGRTAVETAYINIVLAVRVTPVITDRDWTLFPRLHPTLDPLAGGWRAAPVRDRFQPLAGASPFSDLRHLRCATCYGSNGLDTPSRLPVLALALVFVPPAAQAQRVDLVASSTPACEGCPEEPTGYAEPGPGSGEITAHWTPASSGPEADGWEVFLANRSSGAILGSKRLPASGTAVCDHDPQGHDRQPRSLPTLSNVTLVHARPYGRRERRAVALRLYDGSGVQAHDLLASRFRGGALRAIGRSRLLFGERESSVRSALLWINGLPQVPAFLADAVQYSARNPELRDVRDFANPDPRPKPSLALVMYTLKVDAHRRERYVGAFGWKQNWLEEWTVFGPESVYDLRKTRRTAPSARLPRASAARHRPADTEFPQCFGPKRLAKREAAFQGVIAACRT